MRARGFANLGHKTDAAPLPALPLEGGGFGWG
jgi:hypothetical protein